MDHDVDILRQILGRSPRKLCINLVRVHATAGTYDLRKDRRVVSGTGSDVYDDVANSGPCGPQTFGVQAGRESGRGVGSIALLDSRPEWYIAGVTFTIEIEREEDGRWLAEVPALSGVMAYGEDRDEAVARVQALALRVIAERLEHREAPAEFLNVTFQAA
jgi:predicted RNase H-like HicB family nuclease